MLSIVIPTFNEKSGLHKLVEKLDEALQGKMQYELVFVDDSTDGTELVLEELKKNRGDINFIHRTDARGLASAVVLGFSIAKGDIYAVMDADLQHPPDMLVPMYSAIQDGADIVLPSRYVSGGEDEGLNAFRKFASLSAKYAGIILLKSLRNVTDPTSGFFMFRKEVIEGKSLKPVGWKILMEVLVMGDYKNVVEMPYAFHEREADESKFSFKVTIQYFIHIFYLLLRSEKDRRFVTFVLVGLTGVVVDMLAYSLINHIWSPHINVAVTISAFCAMCSNYILNRNVTWRGNRLKSSTGTAKQFVKYVGVSGLGIIIKNIFVFILFRNGMPGLAANFIGILAASLSNFFFSDKWVFRKKKSEEALVNYKVIDPEQY